PFISRPGSSASPSPSDSTSPSKNSPAPPDPNSFSLFFILIFLPEDRNPCGSPLRPALPPMSATLPQGSKRKIKRKNKEGQAGRVPFLSIIFFQLSLRHADFAALCVSADSLHWSWSRRGAGAAAGSSQSGDLSLLQTPADDRRRQGAVALRRNRPALSRC